MHKVAKLRMEINASEGIHPTNFHPYDDQATVRSQLLEPIVKIDRRCPHVEIHMAEAL